MYQRATRRHAIVVRAIAIALSFGPASALGAQSGAKILTPPKPADTAKAAPPRATPKNVPGVGTNQPAASAPAPAAAPVVPQSPVLDSIREVVFRSLLDRDRAGFATLASAFCLGLSTSDYKKAPFPIERADAPEGMVRRVATVRAPARRASTCTFAPNAPGRGITGRALLYTVGAIDLSTPGRAEAAAGYNYDGYSAGGFTFTVERADSTWTVKAWRMEWTAKP